MSRHTPEPGVAETPLTVSHTAPADPADAADEHEEFGLRVNWQSEAVKIEAAEFLVATRVQHDNRVRVAHELELLRHPELDHHGKHARGEGTRPAEAS